MAGLEIRDYDGDFEDVAELTRRVWMPEYRGKVWIPMPDLAYMRWRVGPGSDAVRLVAYEGTKLVGSIFSAPHPLRIAGSIFPASLATYFTVDPDHRRVALPLVQRLGRDNEERGITIMAGMVLGDPTCISYRFWAKYAETFPQNFRFLFRGGYLAKFLSPQLVARAGVRPSERLASRALGPLLRAIPHGRDPDVRPYRPGDLERCVALLDRASVGVDFAMVWSPRQWLHLLSDPTSGTLVLERHGRVQGLVHYRSLMMQGREPVRAALIDLWADDDLAGAQRVRFVSHLCRYLRDRDVHAVIAPRSVMMPTAALVANVFIPVSDDFYIGIHLAPGEVAPSPPKSWSLVIT